MLPVVPAATGQGSCVVCRGPGGGLASGTFGFRVSGDVVTVHPSLSLVLLFLFVEFLGVTLVNKIAQVSGAQCVVCALRCVFLSRSARHQTSALFSVASGPDSESCPVVQPLKPKLLAQL